MTNAYPDYYPAFRCLAGSCRHTCCTGWEIDIDADALKTYRTLGGPLGRRLRASIVEGGAPHFRLGAGDRCPFLNEQNLCGLILEGGEELLCQICRDHPRWRSFLPGYTETGLGLCCEAAGTLILSRRKPVSMVRNGPGPSDPDAAALLAARDSIMSTIWERSLPLDGRMERILSLCGARLPDRTWAAWADLYLGLERLDESWTERLHELREYGDSVDITHFQQHMTGREHEYEQLLAYFLHRHFLRAWDDGDVTGKAGFAVLSTRLIFTLGAVSFARTGSFSPADQVEAARMYSAEIEYSEENLDALYAELWCGDGEA